MADNAGLIGKRVAQRREALRWSQTQLAQEASSRGEPVSRPYISLLEAGKIPTPSAAKLRAIADALNVSIEDFTQELPARRRLTKQDIRDAVVKSLGGQRFLAEDILDRIAETILAAEIEKHGE